MRKSRIVFFGFGAGLLILLGGCGRPSEIPNSAPVALSPERLEIAQLTAWDIPSLPKYWGPIEYPKRLFELDPKKQSDALSVFQFLKGNEGNPFKMVILEQVAKGSPVEPSLRQYKVAAEDEPMHTYFNEGKGFQFTFWWKMNPTRKFAPLAQFFAAEYAEGTDTDGKPMRYRDEGVALYTQSATLPTLVHELLHGFYDQTVWKGERLGQKPNRRHPRMVYAERAIRLTENRLKLLDFKAKGYPVTKLDEMKAELGAAYFIFLSEMLHTADESTVHKTTYELCRSRGYEERVCNAEGVAVYKYYATGFGAFTALVKTLSDLKPKLSKLSGSEEVLGLLDKVFDQAKLAEGELEALESWVKLPLERRKKI